jgi:hypothetical protein
MVQEQVYTAAIVGQAVTLTPKTATESHPTHLGASTIVFNTVANPAPVEMWDAKYEYDVVIRRRTKSN